MFSFNDTLDTYVLKPVAKTYNAVLPRPMNDGISNFFSNLKTPATVVNDLLQGHVKRSATSTGRFLINSTLGLAGFVDVASRIGINANPQDFGLTLAKWGYTNSNYLVLPFLGPKTVRDALSIPVNRAMSITPYINDVPLRNTMLVTENIDKRAELLKVENLFDKTVVTDRYTAVRDAYLQLRKNRVQRNNQLDDAFLDSPDNSDSDYDDSDYNASDFN